MASPLMMLAIPQASFARPAKDELSVLRDMVPRMVQYWSGGVFPNADGATDANRSGYIQVGFQYHTFNLLSASLLNDDLRSLDAAIRVAEYALAHQHGDGSFDYSESNGTTTTGTQANPEAAASSVTLLFYDLGHSLLLLAESSWFTSSDACKPYRARIAAIRQKLPVSLDWLMRQRDLLATDRAASNRTLAHGLAFYLMGRALKRPDAIDAGRQIVLGALDNVRSDGTFPEAGGFDSSYQGINLLECEWLYFYIDPADDVLPDRVWSAIERGFARERTSIADTGEVRTAGNTRIRAQGEAYLGHTKGVNGKQVALALAYYAGLANDSSARDLSERVLTFYYPPK